MQRLLSTVVCFLLLTAACADCGAGEFEQFIKPVFSRSCVRCHGGEETNGDIDLKQIATSAQLLQQPHTIAEVIKAISANNMPPEDEPQLGAADRSKLLVQLKAMLRQATAAEASNRVPVRRLNRLQYNYTVKDLFQLKQDVFPLAEKLMTRRSNYLHAASDSATGKMPPQVNVVSHALNPLPGMQKVKGFPKDLRAAHGFNNQADQLTLSPLLLDAFLRLSVSIVESPDFTPANVGVWDQFFKEPAAGADIKLEIDRRLDKFLPLAFRQPVAPSTRDRYAAYAMAKISQGLPFTASMKKVASAVLSSPLFLYRSTAANDKLRQYELASDLSYFLWGSCPDSQLLELAARGELSSQKVLAATIDRMLADPKVERFLDAFPSQWLQLENLLDATPDPRINKYYSLDANSPASLQMVLEPLLLFDTVFVENRPIVELLAPSFAYRSDFLTTWYSSSLTPPAVDVEKIQQENRRNQQRRDELQAAINAAQSKLDSLRQQVRVQLLAGHRKNASDNPPLDLNPYAAWEFNGDLKSSVGSLDLTPHGAIKFQDNAVVIRQAHLISQPLPIDLKAKSLEVRFKIPDVKQQGGGVMGIQGQGDFFDTIVLGERQPQHWMSGSNLHSRTVDFAGAKPETRTDKMLHLVMVYTADGTTTLYRDGQPYGQPYRKGQATFPKGTSSVMFGLRHLPAGGNRYLNVTIDSARLYDRALTAAEVQAAAAGKGSYISEQELLAALTPQQKTLHDELTKTLEVSRAALGKVPPQQDPAAVQRAADKRYSNQILRQMKSQVFKRVPATDPRFGGVITNAAMLSMTSGPKRTHPIARGAWIIEVIFNDPPPPPPNDVPPLTEEASDKNLTIREKFAAHRENPSCAGCHSRLDPLGFAMENYDITGRWRDKYSNGRDVDASGTLMRKHAFADAIGLKSNLVKEQQRFAHAFTGHLLRFALSRELLPGDSLAVDTIVNRTAKDNFKLKAIIREVILSNRFAR